MSGGSVRRSRATSVDRMVNDQTVAGTGVCPDCGGTLNYRIEGFRPVTAEERNRLTPAAIRALGFCTNGSCPGKRAVAEPRRVHHGG